MIPFLQQPHLRSSIWTLPWTWCFFSPNKEWRPSISDMRLGPSLWTYLELLIQFAFCLVPKLSACGIHGQLHSWITDFLPSRSQRVGLNGTLSSPLPVKAGVPQHSVLDPFLFLISVNYLSNSLKNPLYLIADDSTLCR